MREKVEKQHSMATVCQAYDKSRQAYYKKCKRLQTKEARDGELLDKVRKIRRQHPRMGGRKLLHKCRQSTDVTVEIGRDSFFKVLNNKDLLVLPKRKKTATTNSGAKVRLYENKVAENPPEAPNQAFGCDFTYLRTLVGFFFLALVIDLYSRKIIGFALSQNLDTQLAKKALAMALKGVDDPKGILHHSDNGVQYESEEYRKMLKKHELEISRAAKGSPWENGITERAVGILKDEYGLDATFKNVELAVKTSIQSIYLYNFDRPHTSLDYKTPDQVHQAA